MRMTNICGEKRGNRTNLENVKESTGVETGLLVDSSEQSRLLATIREEGGCQVELQTLGKVVLCLYLSAEDV